MPLSVQLVRVPYDSGHLRVRMGAGPDVLAPAIAARLRDAGASVADEAIGIDDRFPIEAANTFALHRELTARVRAARAAKAFPLVVAGNCGSANATVTALRDDADDVAVIWFDAHGDLETPETTTSGFLDGMGLATLVGACWRSLAASTPGFRPLAPRRVVHLGGRDLSAAERSLIESSGIASLDVNALRGGVEHALAPVLEQLHQGGARRAYVHVDLDVHDPAVARVNGYQPDGGLRASETLAAIRAIRSRLEVAAGAITAYDPTCDPDGRALPLAAALAAVIARAED